MGKIGWKLILLSACQLFIAGDAFAFRVIADAGYSLPAVPGGVSFDESDRNLSTLPGTSVSALANTVASYAPLATSVGVLAQSSASASDIKAGATLVIEDFDPAIRGEGFFVNASARLEDTYTTSSLESVFGSPVFGLTGDLFSSSSEIVSNLHFYVPQLGGTVFIQSGTSVPDSVNTMLTPSAIALSAPTFFSFQLYTSVEISGTDIAPGDYTGYADFYSTVSLLGFALFEDEAMTRPIVDGITVTNGAGEVVPLVDIGAPNPVPLPAAAWLFATALIGLLGLKRRKALHA